jgi:GNAT superfamily N-acetyltransferase
MDITLKMITKDNSGEAKAFLSKLLANLFKCEITMQYHADIIELEDFYVNHKTNLLIGAYDSNDDMVGTIGVKVFVDRFEEIEGRYDQVKCGELARCYISPDLRRSGIGTQLLGALKEKCAAHGLDVIYLHTHRMLPGGLNFWIKSGFNIVYDHKTKDLVHMEYPLRGNGCPEFEV